MTMNVSENERPKMHQSNLCKQRSSTAIRSQPDEHIGVALRLFLQDMMTTMQSLLHRHELMYQSVEVAEKSVQCPVLTSKQLTNFEVSMAPSYGTEVEPGTQEPRGCNFKAGEIDAVDSGTMEQLNEENLAGHQLDVESVDTLKGFLEDMKKIIQAWLDRHQLFLQGLYKSQIKDGENISSLDFITEVALQSSSGLSYVQSIPNHGAIGLEQSSQFTQGVANMDLSDHVGASMVRMPSDNTLQVIRVETFSREGVLSQSPGQKEIKVFERGKELDVLPVHNIPVFESSSKLHNDNPSVTALNTEISVSEAHTSGQPDPGDMVMLQHNNDKINGLPMSKIDQEIKTIDPAHMKMQESNRDAIIQVKTNQGDKTSDGTCQIVAHPSRGEVYSVESPDWLPKDWTTEVRIRGRGSSAGTKDKYFFDPVSNRYFRSKKEVFCFLETGKLGRYKPKSKRLLNEDAVNECIVASQENKSRNRKRKNQNQSQFQNQLNQPILPAICVSAVPSSSVAVPADPPSFHPPGMFSTFLMPYWQGQPSDWLVYKGLPCLPVQFFEHLPYPGKDPIRSNGSKLPLQGLWFFSNTDKPQRHGRKKAKCKAIDECEESLCASETVQQPTVEQPTVQQLSIVEIS